MLFFKNNFISTAKLKFAGDYFQQTKQLSYSFDQKKHYKHVFGIGELEERLENMDNKN